MACWKGIEAQLILHMDIWMVNPFEWLKLTLFENFKKYRKNHKNSDFSRKNALLWYRFFIII